MNAREAIRFAIDSGQMVTMAYLQDLTDAEMLHRPHPQCNHIKWQLGHLISSEHAIIESVAPGAMPALPEGFAERYTPATSKLDSPSAFDSKADLIEVYKQQRNGTLTALDATSEERFDEPAPESMREYAPNVGAAFAMQGGHWMMHAGQWAVIRRQLGKPPLF